MKPLDTGSIEQRKVKTTVFVAGDIPARDPEDRLVNPEDLHAKREKMLDKTIADSFPASDPPSTLPNPNEDSFRRSFTHKVTRRHRARSRGR